METTDAKKRREERELADMVNAANNPGGDCATEHVLGQDCADIRLCATCEAWHGPTPAPVESADVETPQAGEVWRESDGVLLLCMVPGETWRDFGGTNVPWDAPLIARPMTRLVLADGTLDLTARDAAQQRIGAERALRDAVDSVAVQCPKCGRSDSYHGVIVEVGQTQRWACDECGHVEEAEAVCSTCAGTGRVPWAPFQQRGTEDDDQPCPDCVAYATDRRVPTLQIDSPAVRAGIERLIAHWRENAGDYMDMESKTLRQVCNVLESVLEYAVPADALVSNGAESYADADHEPRRVRLRPLPDPALKAWTNVEENQ